MNKGIQRIFLLCAALPCAGAQAYSFQMDTFAVWKNFDPATIGSPWDLLTTPPIFYDSFADLQAPPNAPNFTILGGGGEASYAMLGSVGPESIINGEGILTLDSAGTVPNAYGTPVQQGILRTNVDPNTLSGLKQANTSFAAGGIFNLINPGSGMGSYGVRFTDVGVGTGDNIVSLSVHGRVDGSGVVQFSSFDINTGVRTVISQQVIDTSHAQIGLGLAYLDPDGTDPKAVYAAYFYLDNDVPTSFFDLAGSAQLFDGENFTRAAFFAADTNPLPIPEPAEYLMMLAGLGLVGWRARHHRR